MKIISFLLTRKLTARLFLNFFLKLHNEIYKIISVLSITAEGGKHPKHDILRYHEWFLKNVDENSVVVDIGSNTGTLLGHLAPSIKRGHGIEILPKLAEKAKKQNTFSNIEFIHADATDYNFDQLEGVNVVTLSNVLEHIDHRVEFLQKIIKSLNGRPCKVLIRVPLITRDWLASYKKKRGVEYRLDLTHFTEYTEEEIFQEVKEAGVRLNNWKVMFGEIYLEGTVNS